MLGVGALDIRVGEDARELLQAAAWAPLPGR